MKYVTEKTLLGVGVALIAFLATSTLNNYVTKADFNEWRVDDMKVKTEIATQLKQIKSKMDEHKH